MSITPQVEQPPVVITGAEPALYNRRPYIMEPRENHEYTLLFLHGLGDRGESFIQVFSPMAFKNVKIVLANAPLMSVEVAGGKSMPAWYNIKMLGDKREFGKGEDTEGISASVENLLAAAKYEASFLGDDLGKVFIGGFSQGGSLSQTAAPRATTPLAGVVALSGYTLLTTVETEDTVKNKDTPTLLYHGADDAMVPASFGRLSARHWTEKHGLTKLQHVQEPGLGHSLSRNAIEAIKNFLLQNGLKQ